MFAVSKVACVKKVITFKLNAYFAELGLKGVKAHAKQLQTTEIRVVENSKGKVVKPGNMFADGKVDFALWGRVVLAIRVSRKGADN